MWLLSTMLDMFNDEAVTTTCSHIAPSRHRFWLFDDCSAFGF
jgi:hypothetical protein